MKPLSGVKHWLKTNSAILILSGGIAIAAGVGQDALDQGELWFTDWALEFSGPRRVPNKVMIVAIDDFSLQQAANADLSNDPALQKLREWPWPRSTYALVLDRLIESGAKTIGFDLLFDTPSSHGREDDAVFAASLQRHVNHVVLGVQALSSEGPVAGLSLLDLTPALKDAHPLIRRGLLNGRPDPDGVLRKPPGITSLNLRKQLGPAVPPGMASEILKKPPANPKTGIPLLAPYGPPRTIPTHSIWELLEPKAYATLQQSGKLQDAVVLIGPTAAVFQDLHRSVFSGAVGMPGVELHATEVANHLEGRSLQFVQPIPGWNLILAALACGLGLAISGLERPLHRLGIAAVATVGSLLIGVVLVTKAWVVLPLGSIALTILATGIVSSADATVKLQWQRRRLRNTLGRYLSPAVAAEIADQPDNADVLLQGRLVDVVVLMSDIRGFTAFTQAMTEKGEVHGLVNRLNTYFSEIVDAVHAQQGSVDKFIGDATLAVFGAPLQRSGAANAEAGVKTAIDIQKRLERLNEGWISHGQKPWAQVIVLSYGWVVSGNIGSSSRMDYTVIGDAVNTASRLEQIAKQCNRTIVMSEAVAELLENQWPLDDLGEFPIRGQKPQRVFALKTVTKSSQKPGTYT